MEIYFRKDAITRLKPMPEPNKGPLGESLTQRTFIRDTYRLIRSGYLRKLQWTNLLARDVSP